jgi:glycosyltransferase involved in cell wall biosynthesis
MKIAYLGKIQLSDTDLPYLHEAQQLADITYILEVNPRFLTGPAFNIQEIYPKSGLFKATDIYPEFEKLQGFIDLDKAYVLNTCGRLWVLKALWTNFLLLIFLIRQHFDIIHLAWSPNVYEFILYLLRRKMILTVHDPIPHSGLNTRIVRLRRWFAFRLIPEFILLNKAQRQDFLDIYHLSEQQVIGSQMSCCTYLHTVVPDRSSTPQRGSYILFAGKISPYKGLDYLLPAMEQVHQACPDCRLVVAGGGSYHFDIRRYQALEYIDFRNRFIPDNELVALIQDCAFMVCPYTDATQSGVVMSAFAFNKPVIATNVGALPEMVRHQHFGLIVSERDSDALAASIIKLWTSPQLQRSFSEQIQQAYSTGKMSWRSNAVLIYQAYCKRIQ